MINWCIVYCDKEGRKHNSKQRRKQGKKEWNKQLGEGERNKRMNLKRKFRHTCDDWINQRRILTGGTLSYWTQSWRQTDKHLNISSTTCEIFSSPNQVLNLLRPYFRLWDWRSLQWSSRSVKWATNHQLLRTMLRKEQGNMKSKGNMSNFINCWFGFK